MTLSPDSPLPIIDSQQVATLESSPCPLGCNPTDRFVVAGRDRLHRIPGEFKVVQCQTCGLIRTDPRPTIDTIGAYYPDDYGPFKMTQIRSSVKRINPKPAHIFGAMFRRKSNNSLIPPILPGMLLEIGCASGRFLDKMHKQGWQVRGIEPSVKAARNAQAAGFDVFAGPLETAPDPDEPYDLIAGWMVLEHLHKPVKSLQKLSRWTNPGGWLVVSVPDISALEFKIFRSAWYALDLPRHLFHFTPITLGKVLEAGGWRLEKIIWQASATNLLKSLIYVSEEKEWKRLNDFIQDIVHWRRLALSRRIVTRMLRLTRQSGRMIAWAKRMP